MQSQLRAAEAEAAAAAEVSARQQAVLATAHAAAEAALTTAQVPNPVRLLQLTCHLQPPPSMESDTWRRETRVGCVRCFDYTKAHYPPSGGSAGSLRELTSPVGRPAHWHPQVGGNGRTCVYFVGTHKSEGMDAPACTLWYTLLAAQPRRLRGGGGQRVAARVQLAVQAAPVRLRTLQPPAPPPCPESRAWTVKGLERRHSNSDPRQQRDCFLKCLQDG